MTTRTPRRFSRHVRFSIALVIMAAGPGAAGSVFADARIYQQTLPKTTWVIAKTDDGYSTGTGVLIDRERKLMLTNFHVVGHSHEAVVFFPTTNDEHLIAERSYYLDRFDEIGLKSRVVAIDPKRDLALIELPSVPEGVQPVEFAEKSAAPGDPVHSLGNPGSTGVLWVYTSGTVRAVYYKRFRTEAGEHGFTVVETQSPINAGDSGGPVVNGEGKLVAISQAISPDARLVSYAVDISEIKSFLAEDHKPAPLPVTAVLDKTGLKYHQHTTGPYVVDVDNSANSRQSVYISQDTEFYGHAELRKIWSLAVVSQQVLSSEFVMKLLQQNSRTKIGAWTIERNSDGDYLVIFCAKIDAATSAEALQSTVEYVSKVSAAMSQQLIGRIPGVRPKTRPERQTGERPNRDDWLKALDN